jgi:hypothetical protein
VDRKAFVAVGLALGLATAGIGCESKGTAQSAGEKIDNAKEKVEDAVDPKGPVEKAGRKVDKAVDDLKD